MLHEIISKRKTGNNGSKGLMDYMLKESDKKTPRKGATVLRGDVETQAKLIDSLVGDFKQQYVCGCFSFEESPDEVTEEQKNEIMDGAEEIIRGGLDPDRVSITWIEHTDKINKETGKPRLELNYIVAQVDLEHGRQYQPYIHHRDMPLFNAFKDIQNIKHGFTEPDDPIKKQDYKQVKDLPQGVAEVKKALTLHLHHMIAEGVINNREDIKKEFVNLGFEISRAGKNYISLKRPDGGQNIKFTSSKEGSLYDINFRPSATSAEEIRRASEEFNRNKPERLRSAQRVYETELGRKRDRNNDRHNRKPNPYKNRNIIKRREAKKEDKRKHAERDNSDRNSRNRGNTSSQLSPNSYQEIFRSLGGRGGIGFRNLRFRYVCWSEFNKANQQALPTDLSASLRQQNQINLPSTAGGLKQHEQRTLRQSNSSSRLSAESNRDTRANDTTERQGYSGVKAIIRAISEESNGTASAVTESTRELEEFDSIIKRTTRTVKEEALRADTQSIRIGRLANRSSRDTAEASAEHERLSKRTGTIRNERDKIERLADFTRSNRDSTKGLTQTSRQYDRAIEHATKHIATKTQQKQEQARQQQQNTYRPRFR